MKHEEACKREAKK